MSAYLLPGVILVAFVLAVVSVYFAFRKSKGETVRWTMFNRGDLACWKPSFATGRLEETFNCSGPFLVHMIRPECEPPSSPFYHPQALVLRRVIDGSLVKDADGRLVKLSAAYFQKASQANQNSWMRRRLYGNLRQPVRAEVSNN